MSVTPGLFAAGLGGLQGADDATAAPARHHHRTG